MTASRIMMKNEIFSNILDLKWKMKLTVAFFFNELHTNLILKHKSGLRI